MTDERDGPTTDGPDGQVLARLAAPATDERTRFGVVADPHVSTREAGTSKLFEYTRDHFANAVSDAAARDLDAVLSVGDLTKDGEPWNYEAVDEVLAELPVPFYSVPGNHDVPKDGDEFDTPSVDEYADRYAPPGQGYPFHERVGGVDVIGLNTAGSADRLYESHEGEVDEPQREWLADALDAADTPLVLQHHNMPAMYDQYREYFDVMGEELVMPPTTRNPEPLAETYVEGGAPLVLTGHYHIPAAATGDGFTEVMVPTTCSFPQSYLLVEVGPEGTTIRFVPVADRQRLTYAYDLRSTDSVVSQALTGMASVRLSQLPLVDER